MYLNISCTFAPVADVKISYKLIVCSFAQVTLRLTLARAGSGNNLFIGGSTYSDSDFPLQVDLINYPSAYYQPSNNNSQLAYSPDGFLAQFILTDTPLPVEEVNSEDDSAISVFPNPTNGRLNMVTNGMKGPMELGLYDAIGQKVLSKQFIVTSAGQRLTLDLSQLPKGMYILTCLSDEKAIQSNKVIIN